MLRTVFFPLVRRGAARMPSLLFVFFISAVMHELAVGVPLRMLRGWAFWGMMMQVGGLWGTLWDETTEWGSHDAAPSRGPMALLSGGGWIGRE